ncbi:MAG: YutD family protein [Bacilli bacterium]|nr:YutD family protein [Bacilli bacterium]
MNKIELDQFSYEIVNNEKDCFNFDELKNIITDYFYEFDYIFGDYAYDKLRLKGYYGNGHPRVSNVNNIKTLDNYIKNYCAYGAKFFLLKKIK